MRTDRAIVRAARELLEQHGFEDVTVAAIARRAEVSVGGVYARFPDKAAIAVAVDEDLLAAARTMLTRAMAPERLADQPVAGIVESYVKAMVSFFDRHRRLMRTLVLRARSDERYAAQDEVRAFNEFAHGTLCERLLKRSREIRHPDPGRAVRFGIMMVSAAAREMALFGDRRMNLSTSRGRELVAELTHAFCGYLCFARGPR